MDYYRGVGINRPSNVEGEVMLAHSITPSHHSKHYLIVGLGQTGFSVAQFLNTKGLSFDVQDDRLIPPYKNELKDLNNASKVITKALDETLLKQYDSIIVSPGVSIQTPVFEQIKSSGIEIMGDIELFAQWNNKPVVAISGSNGKTTVTALLGEVLNAAGVKTGVGGNIGTAALDLIAEENEVNVLELSSFQLETTSSLEPVISVVLNVSEDHLDRYKGFEHYQQTKLSIHKHTQTILFNRDDEMTWVEKNQVKALSFGLDQPVNNDEFGLIMNSSGTFLAQGSKPLIHVSELALKGSHNWANCLAVLALSSRFDVSMGKVLGALKKFKGVEHRYEKVTLKEGVLWINDSKGTNPGATLAAIQGTQPPIILIAGGQSKQADISVLNDAVRNRVKIAILFGEDADQFEQQWSGITQLIQVNSLLEAVVQADKNSTPGDCVLFSPACASFDMFANYAQRGLDFKQLVKEHVNHEC